MSLEQNFHGILLISDYMYTPAVMGVLDPTSI